jgi:hypothetical protein
MQELRTSQERYRLIVKLSRVVNSNLDMRKVFRAAARGIRPLFRCERIQLLLVDHTQQLCSGFALEYAEATCGGRITCNSTRTV